MISKYLGDKAFWKRTLVIALPIAFQNLLISSFSLVDTLMVGWLGSTELSAAGMAGQWSWFLNIVLFGICSGASVFFAQYWGANNIKGIHKSYGIALTSSFIVSMVFFYFAFFNPAGVMQIFNKEPKVIELGSAYLSAVSFSYPATAIMTVMNTVLRSTERVKLPMYSSLITTLLNIILNYCLIFGKFGFPYMGIKGAAVATSISTWVGPFIILIVSKIEKNVLVAPLREIFTFSTNRVKEFYGKAAPVILNEGLWGLGTVLFNVIYSNLGSMEYAAVTILKTFENISFVFFVGLCSACCVIVGKYIGSGEIKQAIDDARRYTVILPIVSIVVGALIIIFREQLIFIFNLSGNISETTLKTAKILMLIYALEIPIRNIPYIQIVGIFRSGGDTITAIKYDLSSEWLMALPATFIAAYILKLPFVWVYVIMYIFEDYLKSILCIKHYLSKKWIKPVTEQGVEGYEKYKAETA